MRRRIVNNWVTSAMVLAVSFAAEDSAAVTENWLRRSLGGQDQDGQCQDYRYSPETMAVLADGSIVMYIPYEGILRVDPVEWKIDPEFNCRSGWIADMAIGTDDRIYALAVEDYFFRAFDKTGEVLFSFGPSGSAPGEFNSPWGIDTNAAGDVYVADSGNSRIQVFDSKGSFLRLWAPPSSPEKIAVDPQGSVYVVGSDNHIYRFDSNDQLVDMWGSNGSGPGQFRHPNGIDVDAEGYVYISDAENHRIQRFTPNGNLVSVIDGSQPLPVQFSPQDVCVGSNGFVYTGDGICSLLEFWYAGTMVRASDPSIEISVDGERFVGANVFRWPAGSIHEISTIATQFPTPVVRYEFDDWDGDPAVSKSIVATDPPSAHTAHFRRSYQLTYDIEGAGSCTPPPGWYPEGVQHSLAAQPDESFALSEWIGEGPGSYTGRLASPAIRMNGPIVERVIFRKYGADFTISASDTDPFAVSALPAGGVRNLYFWLTCSGQGVSAFEADVSGSLEPLAFVPATNVLNVYGADRLMLAIGGCPMGSETNRLLGHWVVDDRGGDLCLTPSAENARIATVDCHWLDPHLWEDPRVFCFSSNGNSSVMGTNGCDNGAAPISITNLIARPRMRAVELTWEATGGSNLGGFRVERASAAEGPFAGLHESLLRVEPPCRYEDRDVAKESEYFYRVIAVDRDGNEIAFGPVEVSTSRWPEMVTKLEPIWPNPSAGRAAISFALASPGQAKLAIYDVAGRLVKTIVDGNLEAGSHRAEWGGTDESGRRNLPGVYFARLETQGFTQTRKILYLRER